VSRNISKSITKDNILHLYVYRINFSKYFVIIKILLKDIPDLKYLGFQH